MSAQIENHSKYPTREVKSIVRRVLRRFDMPLGKTLADCSWITVKVRMHRGDYAHRGAWYQDDGLILCRLGYPQVYPTMHDRGQRGGPPPIEVPTWQAALVAITAHEAGHAWQYFHPRPLRKGSGPLDGGRLKP